MKEKKRSTWLKVKKENFSEWFRQIILLGDFADYSEVSGCIVFKPRSFSIWEKVQEEVNKRIKAMGVKNTYFPLFIPKKLLQKEAMHIKGFAPEVAWVTIGGNTELDEKLAIRPTSETIMYDSFRKWIRSWKDLPLKLNQWNNVVRWEFKYPVPFLRTREFLWNEGHTVFATKEDAELERSLILNMYNEILCKYLALPGLIGRKSEREKFAGAEYTYTIELVLPNGKAIQGPDFHHDGQNFAKAFNITYLDKDGKKQFAWQNTWAITTRVIGIMLAVHGDECGAIIPPKVAPEQVVIIPIFYEKAQDIVLNKAREIDKQLSKEFRVVLDDREDYTPGWKFNDWELKGAPLRLEIGPRDVEKDQVILVRRDTGEKIPAKITGLNTTVKEILDKIQENLYIRAKKFLEESIIEVTNFDEFKKAIKNKKIVRAPWCGEDSCEISIREELQGVKTLNGVFKEQKKDCVYCGRPAKALFYFGKSY